MMTEYFLLRKDKKYIANDCQILVLTQYNAIHIEQNVCHFFKTRVVIGIIAVDFTFAVHFHLKILRLTIWN